MTKSFPITCEVCVDSLEGAIAAEHGGAHRLELCANLLEGGTTPSGGLLRLVKERVSLPVTVMVRPRGGDFLYTEAELDTMRAEIELAQEHGADGVVLGLLHANGTVDAEKTAQLCRAAAPLPVTFHRAFDLAREPRPAFKAIADAGCTRLLTSGHAPSAIEGARTIAELRALERAIELIPGGGVRLDHIEELLRTTGCHSVHFSGRAPRSSRMSFRRKNLPLSDVTPPTDHSWRTTCPETVRALVEATRRLA